VTARAEIARLLATFNDLSENEKDIVLKISETVLKPEINPSVQTEAKDNQIPGGKEEPTE
jgi:hypothetical protein